MQATATQLEFPWEQASPLQKQALEETPVSAIPIYTIGYGNRSIDTFLQLLKQYQITFLVDVRSQPYSRTNQPFSRETLEITLKTHGLRYIFMGNTLGGRPKDQSCYTNGHVNYLHLREKDFYQKGITHLRHAWERQQSIALMCAESKPHECHRSKLIGNSLSALHIDVAHIDESGKLKPQEDINRLLLGNQPSLFGESGDDVTMFNEKIHLSRKQYSI